MTAWKTARLESFCKVGAGGTPSRGSIERYYEGGTIPWVKSGELRETIIADTEELITEAALREANMKLVPAGALLLAMYGATVGRLGVLGIPATTNQAVCHIIPDPRAAEGRYLFHALSNQVSNLIARGVGGAQPNISQGIVRDLAVPLPPLPEQRRIAEVLDQAEALRAKRRAALAQLDTLTQSIFLDMFGDPATNPKGWPVQLLQQVVKKGSIVTYGIVQAGEEFPGGVPYIRTGDIVDGEIIEAGLRHTDPLIAAKFHRSRVEAGDIVMSIRATVGTTALVPLELDGANLTQGTGRISPGDKTDRLYLLSFLRASGTQHWISLQIKGATFREITLTRLRELPVAVPPMELQLNFACRVSAVEKLRATYRASIAELDTLFASLQHRAFRGEL